GGMSAVYKATDPNLKRMVAVKIIHSHLSGNQEFVSRFESEAAAVAQLRHPNIIQVYDFNHEGGAYFIVFEFVPGESLQAWLRRLDEQGRQLDIGEAITHTAVVADALDYAHEQNLIHRDIKPANVMMHTRGQPILMDFGIAKIVGGAQHTATGAVLGTARYMSPEQVKGARVDARTDIYSLGVTLFEMVSGHAPYEAESAMTMMMMHVQDPVPDVRKLRPDVPIDLARVISKALAKEPENRFQTAAQMATALRAVRLDSPTIAQVEAQVTQTGVRAGQTGQNQPYQAQITTAPSKTKSSPNWLLMGSAAVIAALLIVLGLMQLWGNGGDEEAGITVTAHTPEATAVLANATEPVETAVPDPSQTPIPALPTHTPPPTETPTETPVPTPPTNTPIPVPEGMIWLPGSRLLLGSVNGQADEQPERSVTISSFFIDQYEVSNAQYRVCVQAGNCSNGFSNSSTRVGYRDDAQFDNYPVLGVTWNQADAYCRSLGRRLPTEAEWEYAAGGPTNFTWPWGNEFDSALLAANSPDAQPVDSFPEGISPFGVFNMAGNVGEWVQDSYDADFYADAPAENPVNASASSTAVFRGGSFANTDGDFFTTSRRYAKPRNQTDGDLGFRCAADLPGTSLEIEPTATVPMEPFVRINRIDLVDGRYEADFETFGFIPNLAGQHIHFFFNTVPPEQAGAPFDVNWFIYGGDSPFTDFGAPGEIPGGATQRCALVASRDHVVTQGSGNCADLPQ
ncbi:MAG: SUMF1/EgtB/PvdO family nonheme iron enzyme, partial [Anaerolineae bacterium]